MWIYRPAQHKTRHHGRERVVCSGPRAQLKLPPPGVKDARDFARAKLALCVPWPKPSMYRHQLKSLVGDDETLLDTALTYVADLLGEFKPRDPVERMLVS